MLEIDGIKVITDREPPVKRATTPPPLVRVSPVEAVEADEDSWFTVEAAPPATALPGKGQAWWLWAGVASFGVFCLLALAGVLLAR